MQVSSFSGIAGKHRVSLYRRPRTSLLLNTDALVYEAQYELRRRVEGFHRLMSATVKDVASSPKLAVPPQHGGKDTVTSAPKGGNYKGFVAGVFSGIAKLTVG